MSQLDDTREEWQRNMQSSVPASETQERLANLIHALRLGDYPSTTIQYLQAWLDAERDKEASLNWFQRAARKWVL